MFRHRHAVLVGVVVFRRDSEDQLAAAGARGAEAAGQAGEGVHRRRRRGSQR